MNYVESNIKELKTGLALETRRVDSVKYGMDNGKNVFGEYNQLTRVIVQLTDTQTERESSTEEWFLETRFLPRRELKLTPEQATVCLKNFFLQRSLEEE